MRAAVYNRFWHSQGGGERHSGMLAQVLSQDGWKVDLVGHGDVDREELADHLALDLSQVELRLVPDRGDEDLARLSTEYDLFVTASYMSRLAPRGRHNVYLCYFPTPFDADMERWRRWAVRRFGPMVRRAPQQFHIGTGWYPPEGGRRRSYVWTQGDAVLSLTPGTRRLLDARLGRPGAPGPTALRLLDEAGRQLATVKVAPKFGRYRLDLGTADEGAELHLVSDTFVPGPADRRELGVAVSALRLGAKVGPVERIGYRFPWLQRDPANLSFLRAYDAVLANSEYTRGWIRRLWDVDAEVLFPPIRLDTAPAAHTHQVRRTPEVVTVGRFFAPGPGHAKRQLEMVRFFGDLVRSGRLPGWTLHVVGGCEPWQLPYLRKVQEAAAGLPVEVHANAPRATVERLLSTAAIFWSATGYGEDEEAKPWAMEHFGITTVEAMGSGCVPVVIDRAGHREIVRDGVDGYRWRTPAELLERTVALATDAGLRARLAASALERAQEFSEPVFADRWRAIAERLALPRP